MVDGLCPMCGKGRFRITHRPNVYQCDNCRTGAGKPLGGQNRIGCCIPFCRASRGDRKDDPITETMEWICSKHWQLVPLSIRHRKAKLNRLYGLRFGGNGFWSYPPGSPKRLEAIKLDRLCRKAWEHCKRAAIEAAGGIG